jgi:hypothetical protein
VSYSQLFSLAQNVAQRVFGGLVVDYASYSALGRSKAFNCVRQVLSMTNHPVQNFDFDWSWNKLVDEDTPGE